MKTTSSLIGDMRKAWYIFEMNKAKKRIKPETKHKMYNDFRNSVMALAAQFEYEDHVALDMEEYRRMVQ